MKIVWFILDAGDARVRKRIMAFQDRGWDCMGFSFSRQEGIGRRGIFWRDVHLGSTSGGRYLVRSLKFIPAMFKIWRHRRVLEGKFVCYAFNIDNLLLAMFARMLGRGQSYLVYECADIQAVFTSSSIAGVILRAVEKWGLGRADLLLTTSPMFMEKYFSKVQKYRGETFILENKVYPSKGLTVRSRMAVGNVWVIGYFGSFRCQRSLELIAQCSKFLKGRVKFLLAGFPTIECAPQLDKCIADADGVVEYLGRFDYPVDLPRLYGSVDLCWGFDWSSAQGNSAWLLPNRLYEAGYFTVPILASRASYLGDIVAEERWGWAFDEPVLESLLTWLRSPPMQEFEEAIRHMEQCRGSRFSGERDYDLLSKQLGGRIA